MKSLRPISFIFLFSFIVVSSASRDAGTVRPAAVLDSLTMLGHATAKIKTAQGKIIYLDPFQPGDYSDSADVVLISHQHNDHNRLNMVRQRAGCTVISNAEAHPDTGYRSFIIGNIRVDAVPAYNANHQRTACVGYVVEFNGIKLYHAGDTGNIIEMAQLAARNLTYALLPMDGIFTMSPEEATQAAAGIQAATYIPMHTMPPPDTVNMAIVARFTVTNKIVVRNGQSIALQSPTSAEETPARPLIFALEQNYPNPFNPTTNIEFRIPARPAGGADFGFVSLKVFDLLGREVATLVNEVKQPGRYEVQWYVVNLPSGVYFYRMESAGFVKTKQMLILK